MEKTIVFETPQSVLMPNDAFGYDIQYSVTEGSGKGTSYHVIRIGASEDLIVNWQIDKSMLLRILFGYAKQHVVERLKQGFLAPSEDLRLITYNTGTNYPVTDITEDSFPVTVTVEV